MMLNSVIIVLREVLEAALLTSVLLSLSHMRHINKTWLIPALLMGMIAAYMYASSISMISNAFEGTGQELANAFLNIIIFSALISWFISLVVTQNRKQSIQWQTVIMSVAVLVATGREAAEVFLYIQGFILIKQNLSPVLFGSAVGAGIGISVGVFFYYSLVSAPKKWGIAASVIIMALLSGSMMSQATQLLIQVDYLPTAFPLWDTSNLISERSVTGQVLYALIGYEATPVFLQVIAYVMASTCALLVAFIAKKQIRSIYE
jgi:high-affinity iron transporter